MMGVRLAGGQGIGLGALAALMRHERDSEAVGTAAGGEVALELLAAGTADVVLADIEMPGMSGLELAAEVRRLHPDTKVMILTTFARPGYLRRALDAGAGGYLLKDSPASQLAE